jgi:hypothetical protein
MKNFNCYELNHQQFTYQQLNRSKIIKYLIDKKYFVSQLSCKFLMKIYKINIFQWIFHRKIIFK